MTSRRFGTLATLALVAGLLGGCAGEPAPVETTPAFASEDEAFAAAEETYRAYVDALNQVDSATRETFEPVFALTTGELERRPIERACSACTRTAGRSSASRVSLTVEPARLKKPHPRSVNADACYDVSDVDVLDADGRMSLS